MIKYYNASFYLFCLYRSKQKKQSPQSQNLQVHVYVKENDRFMKNIRGFTLLFQNWRKLLTNKSTCVFFLQKFKSAGKI